MKITIISVGKKHDSLFSSAIEEYMLRLSRVVDVRWHFISPSGKEELIARKEESALIGTSLKKDSTVWLLDETGTQLSSIDVASKIEILKNSSVQELQIIIGGAYGVDDQLKQRADFIWSLSKLVFPHQIVRLLLVEQLYRASEIQKGSGYHHV